MNAIASSKKLDNSEPELVLSNLPGSPKIASVIRNSQRILYSARPGLRDVLLSEPQGASRGLCIRSAPAASALPLTKPQI